MSLLFGFLGAPSPEWLPEMQAALQHRALAPVNHVETVHGTVAVGSAHGPGIVSQANAPYRDDDRVLAVAGAVYAAGTLCNPTLSELMRLYLEQGLAFVKSLRGQFTLVLLDGPTLHLVRDGAGARTLYYGRHEARLCFACEPKGVLAIPGFPRRLRLAGLAQYLSFSFVPGEQTMLQDLRELAAGHLLTVGPDRRERITRHFQFECSNRSGNLAENSWVEAFNQSFEAAVARRMPDPGEPVGVFLSGGIDSSAVTAEVQRQREAPVRTFSIHFGAQYPNELDFARSVAEHCGTVHEEVLIEPKDFLPRMRKMIWHLDEPIGDPITMPNFELAARLPDDIRYVFNGEGGDPVFGGPKNIPMLLQHWYGGIERPPNFRERAYLASYRRGFAELDQLLTPAIRAQIHKESDLETILRPYFDPESGGEFLDKLTAANIRLKGAHLILPKVDRMLGSVRLESLSPFFDEDMIRLSFQMPSRMRLAQGVEKIIIKQAMQDRLPQAVLDRPKSGMRVPLNYWFRGELARYARHILSRREINRVGLFDPKRVAQLLRFESADGTFRNGICLWMLLTFELWRRIVLDGEAP